MGDLNAHIETRGGEEKRVVGAFGIGERNTKQEQLIDYGLTIMNTSFKHEESKK